MLVTREEANEIVQDYKLVKVSKTGKCCRKDYVDIRENGNGYIVTEDGIARYYEEQYSMISDRVYNGDYSIRDALITANNVVKVDYHGVKITPTWCVELNTVNGKVDYRRVEEYRPITISGNVLTLCWVGCSTNRFLRNKIRRKMKEQIHSGKAKLIYV